MLGQPRDIQLDLVSWCSHWVAMMLWVMMAGRDSYCLCGKVLLATTVLPMSTPCAASADGCDGEEDKDGAQGFRCTELLTDGGPADDRVVSIASQGTTHLCLPGVCAVYIELSCLVTYFGLWCRASFTTPAERLPVVCRKFFRQFLSAAVPWDFWTVVDSNELTVERNVLHCTHATTRSAGAEGLMRIA